MLAGNVHAFMDDGDLKVRGGSEGESLKISAGTGPGEFTISSLDDTTINDSVEPVTLRAKNSIRVRLNGGDNRLILSGIDVRENIKVKTHGPGATTVHLIDATIDETFRVKARRAEDPMHVCIQDSVMERLRVKVGHGDDRVDMTGSTVTGSARLKGKNGTDILADDETNSVRNRTVRGFEVFSAEVDCPPLDGGSEDTTAPALVVRLSNDSGMSASDRITFDPTITGTVTDDTAVTTLQAQVDGGVLVDVPFDSSGTYTFDPGLPRNGSVDGPHTVRFTATDRAGNRAPLLITFTLDMTAPSVAIASPATGSTLTTPDVSVTGTVSDVLSGVDAVTCNGVPASVAGSSFMCSLTLNAGPNSIVARARDLAGNEGTATSEVALTQSLAPVPDVVGQPQLAARSRIAGAGLSVGAVAFENDAMVQVVRVVTQDPAPGTQVPNGSAVDVVISLGPELVTVPDVVGLPQAGAQTAITDAGFPVGRVTTAFSDTVPAGHVSSQIPKGGSQVLPGTPVDIALVVGTVNDPPQITSEPVTSVTERQPYNYDVDATDPDVVDTLAFTLPLQAQGMTIDPASGVIQWTPSPEQVGLHDVTVMVDDGHGGLDFQTFIVSVAAMNEAPNAQDDAYEVRVGETLSVPAAGVMDNDSDPNGDSLSAMLLTSPTNGTVDLRSDGSFSYTPAGLTPVQGDLTELLRPELGAVASSSSSSARSPQRVIDGDLNTPSWLTAFGDAANLGTTPFLEVWFPRDVTVTQIQMFGNREIPVGFDFFAGIFQLRDVNGAVLFDSGVVNLPAPDRDVTVAVPNVGGVRRVRFIATADEGSDPGFAELKVFGSGLASTPLQPVLKWKWTGSTVEPTFKQVIATPIVANLSDDNQDGRIDQQDIPDILFVTTPNTGIAPAGDAGVLRAVSGQDGSTLFDVTDPALRTAVAIPVAVGDLDGDRLPEIVSVRHPEERLVILNHDGTLQQFSQTVPAGRFGFLPGATPSIADLNHDGIPEIIVGATVFTNTGQILFSHVDLGQGQGFGGISTAVDLDLNGDLEIVTGFQAYRSVGSVFYNNRAAGGYPAIGNFDDDPNPEVVVVSEGNVVLLEHDGTLKWGPKAIPSGGRGGPPTVADFDGDGQPEIGVAGQFRYVVFEPNGDLRWTAEINDTSSAITGSAVFDFNNDGSAEVVYNDEQKLRIFSGATGAVIFETVNPTGTLFENPVIADVDNDGHADIVAVRNNVGGVAGGVADKQGVFVFTGQNNDWARARRIWNQHTYHVTNVNENGTVPQFEKPNWLIPGLNNFRQQSFSPDDEQAADTFTYKVSDGQLESDPATVFVSIRPRNSAPEILSSPDTTATVGFPYLYHVRAFDADPGDELTFSIDSAPGMLIDPSTGLIRWQPTADQVGQHFVTVRVQDRQGFMALQPFSVEVRNPVVVPNVVGLPQAEADAAIIAASLVVDAVATSNHPTVPAGSVFSQSPSAGAAAEPASGVNLIVSLGPLPSDIDDDLDTFSENHGDCNDSNINIHPGAVDSANNGLDEDCDGTDGSLPLDQIVVSPRVPILLVGNSQVFDAVGVFTDSTSQNLTGVATWASSDPTVVTITSAGVATALSGGVATISATRDGIMVTSVITVHARVAGDMTPPTADIITPEANSTITSPVQIIGTAVDDNFLKYILEFAPAGETTFTTLVTSSTPVVDGVLGAFDPTLLIKALRQNSWVTGRHSGSSTLPLLCSSESTTDESRAHRYRAVGTDLSQPYRHSVHGPPPTAQAGYRMSHT